MYSKPGEGCTFRCYFPPTTVETTGSDHATCCDDTSTGTETVLVTEDEAQMRSLLRRCLASRGYTVLEASHGGEALEVVARHHGPIHLLVTDVVMPHMSGKELAQRLQADRPNLRVLFISGYSDEAIERHGVLAPGAAFLQKPLHPDVLARTVRQILDGKDDGNGRSRT